MDEFQTTVAKMTKISVNKAQELINDKADATIFVGRATCPYCRRFAGKLDQVIDETHAHIYFVNSEEISELHELSQFRQAYNIPTVPGFVQVDKGQVQVVCDSSLPIEDIKAFAHLV